MERIQSADFHRSDDIYSIHVQLCNNRKQNLFCNGIESNVCLVKNQKHTIDIGSKTKGN